MKLVLMGPPRSGKSCLREGLKKALMALPGATYPYIITGCPDGEGAWFQETVNVSPELAAAHKAAYKSGFTPAFVARVAASVRDCTLPLVIVDIGGIPSAENRTICADATHAVILSGDPTKVAAWRAFCADLGIAVLAEIASEYDAVADRPLRKRNGTYRGSVHHLERGEAVAMRPTIVQLARIIARLTPKGDAPMAGQFFKIDMIDGILKVGFGDPAQNDVIVKDAVARLKALVDDGTLSGGPVLRINGPASLPVAVALTHAVAHLYGAVAVYDPKLAKYVVSVSHNPTYAVGDLID